MIQKIDSTSERTQRTGIVWRRLPGRSIANICFLLIIGLFAFIYFPLDKHCLVAVGGLSSVNWLGAEGWVTVCFNGHLLPTLNKVWKSTPSQESIWGSGIVHVFGLRVLSMAVFYLWKFIWL